MNLRVRMVIDDELSACATEVRNTSSSSQSWHPPRHIPKSSHDYGCTDRNGHPRKDREGLTMIQLLFR